MEGGRFSMAEAAHLRQQQQPGLGPRASSDPSSRSGVTRHPKPNLDTFSRGISRLRSLRRHTIAGVKTRLLIQWAI